VLRIVRNDGIVQEYAIPVGIKPVTLALHPTAGLPM
jgi:hypothetical protein